MKVVIALALIGIVAALISAGVYMLRSRRDDGTPQPQMARALAVRVALSVALFGFILLAHRLGWIQPGG
jgi:uncharacterized membrane protein